MFTFFYIHEKIRPLSILSLAADQKINAVKKGSTNKIELKDNKDEHPNDFVKESICELINAEKLKEIKISGFMSDYNIEKLVNSIKKLGSNQNQVNAQIFYIKLSIDKIGVDSLLKDLPNVECKVEELNENDEWVTRMINEKNPSSVAAAVSVNTEVLPAADSSEDDSDFEHVSQKDLSSLPSCASASEVDPTPLSGVYVMPESLN